MRAVETIKEKDEEVLYPSEEPTLTCDEDFNKTPPPREDAENEEADYGEAKEDRGMSEEESELPEPQSAPCAHAPDGASDVVSAEEHYANIFKNIECPKKNIPPIQPIETDRTKTLPFLMRSEDVDPWQNIFGPVDWPSNVPADIMTATYIPTEEDARFDNVNLFEKDNALDQSSRMGFSLLQQRILAHDVRSF